MSQPASFKRLALFFLLLIPGSTLLAETIYRAVPLTKNPATWPRSDVETFGCFLQKELGYRHPKFNCDLKRYKNKGDPNLITKEYYEGPSFPEAKLQQIHPAIQGITLHWEHGDLQGVTLNFEPGFGPAKIRESFQLRQNAKDGGPNLMSFDIQDSGRGSYSLILQGFDHQGAGD